MKTIKKNNRTINVWLPNKLFKDLKIAVEQHKKNGETPNLQLAQAAYLVNLLIYIPFKYRWDKYKEKYQEEWVPICSSLHKNIRNFSKYMKFLEDKKFIERTSYSSDYKKCRRYRLTRRYRGLMVRRLEVPANSNFASKRQDEIHARMRRAEKSVPHLTKWLNPEHFQIDMKEAIDYVRSEYRGQSKIVKAKKRHRLMTLESFKHGEWRYSREGEDNRLHSLLTTVPRDLRKFIKYQNSPLVSIDVRNSQPFMFAALLNNTLKGTQFETNNDISHREIYKQYSTIMFDKLAKDRLYGNLRLFIYEVFNGIFYEEYGEHLLEVGLLMTNSKKMYFLEETSDKGMKLNRYSNVREAGKNVMMKTLFSHHANTQNYIMCFKNRYPEVYELMQVIKKHIPEDKGFFPKLLQRVEADFMLDYATKRISDQYPEIPLLTIHDSIVTTEKYTFTVFDEIIFHLANYFGDESILEIEFWCPLCEPEHELINSHG